MKVLFSFFFASNAGGRLVALCCKTKRLFGLRNAGKSDSSRIDRYIASQVMIKQWKKKTEVNDEVDDS